MRKFLYILLTFTLTTVFVVELDARGGRGGGRGGRGGGGGRTRSSMSRTPSMSRSRSYSRSRTSSRSRSYQSRSPQRQEPRRRPSQYSQRQPDRTRRADRPSGQNRANRAYKVRDLSRKNANQYNLWFGKDFQRRHPNLHRHFYQGNNWWRPATWGTLAAWGAWSWRTPIYYDYGYGGNVYYEDDMVYVDGKPAYSAEEYADQAEELATDIPAYNDAASDWLSLGVFALVQDSDAATRPDMYLQLSINKDGIITGTYFNTITDTAERVEGRVDQDSQRVAWTIVGKNSPVIETGIHNLTQREASVLMHFPDGRTQQWTLIRIDEPQQGRSQ